MRKIGDHAVVIGGSMAGLVTARVLAEAYERVTIVDRDELPTKPQHRRGAAQSRHAHGLLYSGLLALEELFPGLKADLMAAGVPTADIVGQGRWYVSGHLLARSRSGMVGLGVSRPLLEAETRARVRALPNLVIRDRCDVLGPSVAENGRIVGVRLLGRADGSAAEVLAADLVVDASGRGSRTPAWLDSLGYPRPPEEHFRVILKYATRHYRLTSDDLGGDGVVMVGPTLACLRGGIVLLQEDGRAIVTLGGLVGDEPPTDSDGFVAYAAGLRMPDIHEVIRNAEPVDQPVVYSFPASVRRHYERLRRFPDGLLVVGDALCSFNPTYGQGMSVAALEALALRGCLASGDQRLARRFFRQAARIVDGPWEIVAGDLRFPQVDGRRTPARRIANAYLWRLYPAAEHDPVLANAFLRVAGLLERPESLLHPEMAWRVLRGNLRRRDHAATRSQPASPVTPDQSTVR